MENFKGSKIGATNKTEWEQGDDERKLLTIKDIFRNQGIDLDSVPQDQIRRVGFHTGFIKDEDGEIQYTKPLLNGQFNVNDGQVNALNIEAVQIPENIKRRNRKIGHRVIAISSDYHIGFRGNNPTHDRRALEAYLEILHKANPDFLVNLGDLFDFAELSKYPPDSNDFVNTLQPTLQEAHNILAQQTHATPNAQERIVLAGNHDCFDEKTEVLTDNGWKKYNEVRDEDKIASFNIKSEEITFNKPIAKIVKDFNGEINRLGGNFDLSITDKHRLLFKKTRNSAYEIERLADLPVNKTKRLIPVAGINYKEDYPITDEEIRLVSWSITDCHIRKMYNSVVFSQRLSNHQSVQKVLDENNLEYRKTIRVRDIKEICGKKLKKQCEPSVEFRLSSTSAKLVKGLLDNGIKSIPTYVKYFSKRQFDIFLNEIINADGTTRKNNASIYKHKEFLDDLQVLSILNGYRAYIYEYRPTHFRLSLSWGVNTRETYTNKFHKEKYVGKVWCFTTVDDTIVVRRNGRVAITGNCRLENKLLNQSREHWGLKAVGEEYPAMSIPSLLKLDQIGHQWVGGYPANQYQYKDDMVFIHGSGGGAKPTDKLIQQYPDQNVFQGHLHHMESKYHTDRHGRKFGKFIIGMMGRIDGVLPSVHSGIDTLGNPVKRFENWQQGVAIVNDYGDGNYEVSQIPINEGKAYWQGHKFEGRIDIPHQD